MGGESTLGRDDQIGWIPEKQVGDVQKNFFFMCTALAIVGLFIHVGEVKHWYLEKKPLNRRGDLLERKHRIKKRVVLYNFWSFFFFFFIPWSLKISYTIPKIQKVVAFNSALSFSPSSVALLTITSIHVYEISQYPHRTKRHESPIRSKHIS